jgi:hypothetical protein
MFLLRTKAPLLKAARTSIQRLHPVVRQTAVQGSSYVTGKFILTHAPYTTAATTQDDNEVCMFFCYWISVILIVNIYIAQGNQE